MGRARASRSRHAGCCAVIQSPGSAVRRASIQFHRNRAMTDNKNLFAAILLCAAVLFGWQYFVAGPQMREKKQRQALAAKKKGREGQTKTAELTKAGANISAPLPRSAAL